MSTIDVGSSEAEKSYFQILDAAPDAMIVVGVDQTIAFVNAQTERLFGYRREELVHRSLEILVPDRFRRHHGAHVSVYFASPKLRLMGSGLELFGRCKDGREIPIEVSLSPLQTPRGASVCAAIRDISVRKELEAKTRLSAERLASAVESIQDPIALFDASDQLVQCNSAYRSLIADVVPGKVLGKSYEALLDGLIQILDFEGDQEKARFRTSRLAERNDPRGSVDVRTRDGRHLRIANRRTSEGGIVKTTWDLTEDFKREDELRDARVAAEAASRAKSEFLSSISHELRTPLNAVLGFAQLLRRDKKEPLSERHKVRIDQILKGGEHLLRLIDDVLDLSRIEAGGISISAEPVGVSEVLEEVTGTLEPAAQRSNVTLGTALLAPSLPMVTVDRTRFAQILMNYGTNAIKYNRPGGKVTFTVDRPRPERVRVTVSDTGLGIASDYHDRIFQPFQRAGQETGPIEGTGIGLAISKRLAELMGGDVGFRSTPSEGSAFWVEVPVHAEPLARPTVSAPVEPSLVPDPGRRGVVLYVEDNPANVAFMEDLLGAYEGIELVSAPTAEMGVELARTLQPNVVIMDINLPGMSGIDALHALRASGDTRDLPVIALTAAASDRDRQKGEKAGFYRYLTKPIKVDELEAALDELLSLAGP